MFFVFFIDAEACKGIGFLLNRPGVVGFVTQAVVGLSSKLGRYIRSLV